MAKYNIVETTKVSGRCFDFVYDADIENGSLIAKGELVDGERNIYNAKIPTVGDEVFLVANPAWDYDDCRKINQNEENYINKAGKPFRAYGLLDINHDKFAVEDYGITATDDIEVGDYVTVDGTTVKIKKDDGTPSLSTNGFVGKVTEVEEYGFAYTTGTAGNVGTTGKKVVIEVVQNKTIV